MRHFNCFCFERDKPRLLIFVCFMAPHQKLVCSVCTRLPTEFGDFLCFAYSSDLPIMALVQADKKIESASLCNSQKLSHCTPENDDSAIEPKSDEPVLLRLHSECITSEVFSSVRCDCKEQLKKAMKLIQDYKTSSIGVIIYLRQEGRGIGIIDKLRAYNLQDKGIDTLDANLMLGHPEDLRDYSEAIEILTDLGLMGRKIKVLTNNPLKIKKLRDHFHDVERIPLIDDSLISGDTHLAKKTYVKCKIDRMNHTFN